MAYTQVTRAQYRALLREQLGSGGLATSFWRDDELNLLIGESLRFFNLLTGYWRVRATLATVANASWYVLPGTITSGMRVSFNIQPLTSSSFYDLDFGRSGWESEKTTDGGDVPTRPQLFVIGALNLIGIWPADAAGGNGLIIDGLAVTPILANDAATLDVGQSDMQGLLDLGQHLAAFKEGGKEFASSMAGFKSFMESAGERNGILKRCSTYKKWLGLDKSRLSRPLKAVEGLGAR